MHSVRLAASAADHVGDPRLLESPTPNEASAVATSTTTAPACSVAQARFDTELGRTASCIKTPLSRNEGCVTR
jgi:hypothetical protein